MIASDLHENLVPCLFTAASLFAIRWFTRRRKYVAAVNHLPGLPLDDLHPFFGHLDKLLATRGEIPNRPGIPLIVPWILKRIPEYARTYGVMRVWFFNPFYLPFARANLNILDAELAKQILLKMSKEPMSNHIVKEKRVFRVASPLFGNSFLSLPDGPVWRHQRKMAALAFHTDLMQTVCTTVYELLSEHVFPEVDKHPQVEGMLLSAKITTELLGLVGFSHSFGSFDDKKQQSSHFRDGEAEEQSLFEVFSKILEVIAERLLSPPILHWTKFKQNREFRQATKHLDSVIGGIVKQRLEKVTRTKREEVNANRSTTSSPSSVRSGHNDRDILSVLAHPDENGKHMSYNDIFGNVRMFLFAGHDTTAATVAWAFWELATHPKVQQKLQEEIDEMFVSHYQESSTDENVPEYNQISQLKYLDAVVKETLRIHSPAPVVRTCTKEMTLKRADQTLVVPQGMSLFMFPLYIQTMEAADFFPERFLGPTNGGQTKNSSASAYTYMPFSVGPRGCVGAPMAIAEIKSILVHVLRRYAILPSANAVEPLPVLMLTVKPHRVMIELEVRKMNNKTCKRK